MEIKTIDELLELELDEMTFDEVFEAFFTTDDDDTEYRACTYSGRPMHRELFGSDPGSWGVIIPTWAEINQRVVLAPICYTTQGAYQLAGWRL